MTAHPHPDPVAHLRHLVEDLAIARRKAKQKEREQDATDELFAQ